MMNTKIGVLNKQEQQEQKHKLENPKPRSQYSY